MKFKSTQNKTHTVCDCVYKLILIQQINRKIMSSLRSLQMKGQTEPLLEEVTFVPCDLIQKRAGDGQADQIPLQTM